MTNTWDGKNFSTIEINRPPYTRSLFDIYGSYNKPEKTIREKVKEKLKDLCTVNSQCCLAKILNFLPFIRILSTYTLSDFPSDIASGLTVGIMHIPQGRSKM